MGQYHAPRYQLSKCHRDEKAAQQILLSRGRYGIDTAVEKLSVRILGKAPAPFDASSQALH